MRRISKVGSNGRTTVPAEVRRRMNTRPGDTLVSTIEGQEAAVRVHRRAGRFAKYRGIGMPGLDSGRGAVIDWVRQLRGE